MCILKCIILLNFRDGREGQAAARVRSVRKFHSGSNRREQCGSEPIAIRRLSTVLFGGYRYRHFDTKSINSYYIGKK